MSNEISILPFQKGISKHRSGQSHQDAFDVFTRKFYLFYFILYWSVISLQCVGFCCTTKWISYMCIAICMCVYIYIYISPLSLEPPSHPPPYPTPLDHHWAPSWATGRILNTGPGHRLRVSHPSLPVLLSSGASQEGKWNTEIHGKQTSYGGLPWVWKLHRLTQVIRTEKQPGSLYVVKETQ